MSNNKTIENENSEAVTWLSDSGKLQEEEFCRVFTETVHPLICIKGIFIDRNGIIEDVSIIEKEVTDMLVREIKTNVPQKVKEIMGMMRIYCRHDPLPVEEDRIHLSNGTLFLDGSFTEENEFCLNRLPVEYSLESKGCPIWMNFINNLFYPEDIPTVQEYLGNLLIPSTRSQRMMVIKGEGGEGKSRIGIVLKKIMGANMYSGSLPNLERDRYARGQLEFRLLFLDDDLMLSALPDTNNVKTIVTAEADVEVERKYIQAYQTRLYSRLMAFGNGNLRSLHDRTKGFYRRQLIISTKPVPEGRKNDPYLADKMCEESEQIFWWMFAGLRRLKANDFRYTVSERTERNLREAMREGTNYADFMESEGYIEFDPKSRIPSSMLYEIYGVWCRENASKPGTANALTSFLNSDSSASKYGITYTNKAVRIIDENTGKPRYSRGFIGIKPCFTRYPTGHAGLNSYNGSSKPSYEINDEEENES